MRNIPNIKNFRADGYMQVINIVSGDVLITESDIISGGFSYDSEMIEGDAFQVGTAIADEVIIKIDNRLRKYNKRYVGVEFDISIASIPLNANRNSANWYHYGTYVVVDVSETYSDQAVIKLHDKFCLFDTVIPRFDIDTLYNHAKRFCYDLNIELNVTDAEKKFLQNLTVYTTTNKNQITYRDFFRHCAQLMLENAYIDKSSLAFKCWNETSVEIRPSERYSSALQESVYIGKFKLIDDDGSEIYVYGENDGQAIEISRSVNSVVDLVTIGALQSYYRSNRPPGINIIDEQYYPLEMTTVPFIDLETGDVVKYIDKEGNEYKSIITSIGWILNGSTSITSSAESKQEQMQYIGKLTDQNKYLLDQASGALDKVNDLENALTNTTESLRITSSFFVGTIDANGGILQANGKDIEIMIGGT